MGQEIQKKTVFAKENENVTNKVYMKVYIKKSVNEIIVKLYSLKNDLLMVRRLLRVQVKEMEDI